MITWLGHAGFKIVVAVPESGEKKTIFIDPWFGSPVCPENEKNQEKADLILVTHGHLDHCSDSPALSKKTGANVICVGDLRTYITDNGGTVNSMNKGGTLDFDWGSVIMVGADHSAGCIEGGYNGGAPVGFVLQFKDGSPSVYHAGDTNVFADMKIISDLHQPTIALVPIGGHYTMGPREAAYALNQLLHSVRTVVPMHFGTFPLLAGTPSQLKELLETTFKPSDRQLDVCEMTYGQTLPLLSLIN